VRFVPLPAASSEVEEIAGLWTARTGDKTTASVVRLTGPAASESAFKEQAAGHRVLHFGTHGFFLGGECGSASIGTRGVHAQVDDAAIDNPLLLSGLALAGANCRDASDAEQDDGMLMAAEIATMDLAGVEWAVLAACDTGAGELRKGEGVFGLRRAFETAGARTTIMSLWPVGDRFTREWMVELYRGRLAEGLATDAAVHAATLRLLERARSRGNAHPFYWAGFVAAGDWR
jgi:CHAT domain-containing protein